jgi:hypothetical protein
VFNSWDELKKEKSSGKHNGNAAMKFNIQKLSSRAKQSEVGGHPILPEVSAVRFSLHADCRRSRPVSFDMIKFSATENSLQLAAGSDKVKMQLQRKFL